MLDLRQYSCLGAALRDALDRFSSEICLIEAERDREKVRLTYSDFKEIALPLARALEDADYDAGDRAAIIMTNQSKWLISAYAIFYCGGVLVPLDYKLTAAEHLQLIAHSKAKVLIVEYHLWRAIMESPDFHNIGTKIVLVTEAHTVEHFVKTGVGAQRVEFFVNREPVNEIGIPHLVSFFQCFKRFFPHSQVHVTPGNSTETVLFLQQDFQLALPVSSHSPRGQGASEFRSSLIAGSNRLLVLTFLLPTH